MRRYIFSFIMASLFSVLTVQAAVITLHRDLQTPVLETSNGFHHFTVSPGPLYAPPGYPELPHVGHQILLPPGEELVSVQIKNEVWQVLPGQYLLYPAQEPVPYSRSGEQPFTAPNAEIYQSDALYPSSPVESHRTDFLSGHGIASIAITTARYQPAPGVLEVLVSYDLVAESAPSARAQEALSLLKAGSRVTERIYGNVDNPEALGAYGEPDQVDDLGVNYLIITTPDFLDPLQPLIEHYADRGMQTEVVYVEDIISGYPGVDTPEKMRNCVIDYYQNNPLEYLLLCGDTEYVPDRGLFASVGSEQDPDIPADLYFSNLDGDWNADGDEYWGEPNEADLYAEIAVGRFAVDSYAEAYNMVSKTIRYQNTPVTADIEKGLMVGEDLGWLAWGGEYKDEIRLGCTNYGYATTGFPANFTVNTLYDMNSYWSAMGDLLPILNQGTHLVNHLGHANNTYCMKFYAGNVNDINMTNNGVDQGYYIMYSQGCYAGAFDNRTPGGTYTSDAIQEAFTTIMNGAVAYLGNSRYGWGSYNNTNGASQYYDRQFFDALFGEAISNIGWTNADSKEDCIPFLAGATYWVYYEMNLLGDPALDIWTGQPLSFTPDYPDTLVLGIDQVEVDVGEEGAQVTVSDASGVIGSAISYPNGVATVLFDEPLSVPGELQLSITAHNYYTYNGTITVMAAEGPFIILDDAAFDDSIGGNGDGMADLGETLTINATFKNVGVEDAQGVTATLSIDETCVNILRETVDLGDLAVNESITVEDAFEITLLPTVNDGQELEFVITIQDQEEHAWTSNYDITAHAPDLELISYTLDDGNDGYLLPGETATLQIELQNQGSGATVEMTVTLTTDNPSAAVSAGSLPMTVLQSDSCAVLSPYEFSLDPGMADPSALVLYINASDTRGYQENFLIEVPVGGEFDDMEAGVGDWTHEAVTTGWLDQWNWAQLMNHTPGGSSAWYCGNNGQYADLMDAGLVTPEYTLYGKHVLKFYHWMSAQLASSNPGYCYDGGIVEMSLNGGPFEQITPRGGYPFRLQQSGWPVPLPQDTPCYSGQVLWEEAVFDIVGEGTARFRFRFVSNEEIHSVGWFIDDLKLLMESTPNPPTNLQATLENDEVTLSWNTPNINGGSDLSGKPGERPTAALDEYRIYRDGTLIGSIEALNYVDDLSGQPYGSYIYQVSGVFDGEEGSLSEPVTVDYVGISPQSGTSLPTETALREAYPNPFNPEVTLRFDLAKSATVRISIFDLLGRRVADLLDGRVSAGTHHLRWNASDLPSGLYLVRMETEDYALVRKILLLK